jgi:hypothetical protein
MSQDTTFKISDWIGKEKSMSTAPPQVHKMVEEEFTVPQQFQFPPPRANASPCQNVEFHVAAGFAVSRNDSWARSLKGCREI